MSPKDAAGDAGRTLGGHTKSSKQRRSHAASFSTNFGPALHPHHASVTQKRCAECGACETPQWRQGPSGPQTLCNACGVRYSRLLRRQRSCRKRQPALEERMEQQDVSDATDSNSKDGVTIALHPLRGSSDEEPLQSDGAAAAAGNLGQLPLFLPRSTSTARGQHGLCSDASVPAGGLQDNVVCEAALDLLSMATGQRQPWSSSRGLHADHAQARSLAQWSNSQWASAVLGSEVLHQLLPLLTRPQLAHLKELCQQFDSLHKELVAAQAAQDAVAKILEIKQEEAKQADNLASMAAKALRHEALKLSRSCTASQLRARAFAAAATGSHPRAAPLAAATAATPSPSARKCHSPKRARFQ